MTVYDNLAFPLKNNKVPASKIKARVHEIAEVLEIEDKLYKKAKNLTADEKQKVSMGRGLVREDVSAILFDEPLTVIDPQLKWKLRRKLKQIHEQFDITMVYVTHDQLEASTFADKIAVMYGGQIVQFGTPTELFEQPNHTFVGFFIGSPGMNLIEVQRCPRGVCFGSTVVALEPGRLMSCSGPGPPTSRSEYVLSSWRCPPWLQTIPSRPRSWMSRTSVPTRSLPCSLTAKI